MQATDRFVKLVELFAQRQPTDYTVEVVYEAMCVSATCLIAEEMARDEGMYELAKEFLDWSIAGQEQPSWLIFEAEPWDFNGRISELQKERRDRR